MLIILFSIGERIPIQTPNSRTRFFQAREDDASHIMKNKEFFIFIFFPIWIRIYLLYYVELNSFS